ncbi:proteasome subunit beta type-4-like [Corticium candelabrum]|uniref:proteasome subunit beta type-4-like n=1 Tax=Corticium candelabrum TaxID=121492 RepID=UPI002E263D3E|nr:proteasome subunit beta type-4-like [Corticium candelabrum]
MDDGILPFWRDGPIPGSLHQFPGRTNAQGFREHTRQPIVMGTSVLGVKFGDGVMVAADTLGSYGSLARFRSISRFLKVNNETLVAASGDYADFQLIEDILKQKVLDDELLVDDQGYSPASIFSWLTRFLYYRRCRLNPIWNTFLVAGVNKGESFLGQVDMLGVAYESPTIATGYGAYIARPLLRDAYERNATMSSDEARQLLEQCLRVLFYRDARSLNKFEIATITQDGVTIDHPRSVETSWEIGKMVKGYD